MEPTPAAPSVVFDSKVVKPPPNIHHAGVEAADGPLIKAKGASEVVKNGVSVFSSKSRLHRFLGADRCGIKENNIIYITRLHTSKIPCFIKFKA